ncbi:MULTISPECIES: ParA family protein [Alphaproteobacteria]|uniref:Chromosome partitioning protein ParA n=2 Tax=Alphaproteobacteria TaxID=28211 RepID=A0A512HLB5_9HYPH|nr:MULTISPECIES: ParA family protein [Alphaproteobacteria]GEO86190.1 chromosome partitioning protein ParA [Ciceribacter naphthalenivorans]GLR21432.1 chromosome partitioning protein ParA [Ciceribacter naphthalenivorans]GLT04288.1 chromosome partitioning protein ParA [Sphingomonas psychrolutea]
MPVITFANTKGGAGKTTAVLLLATELEQMGFKVTILDADPQYWISRWRDNSAGKTGIKVIPYVTQASLEKHIQEGRREADYVLIDLPGARTPLLAKAIGHSDHVLIPIQGCSMDAQGGAHVIELMQYLADRGNIHIPFSVVLTRVNSMVTTRALQTVKALLAERRVHVLNTPIIERSAFRDVFDCGGSLHTLATGRASNIDKARDNARAFADEVLMHEALRCRKLQLGRAASLQAVA